MKQILRQLFVASRPISWINTAYPFAVGYFAITQYIDAFLIIGTLYFLIPYNLLMYGINDVFDYESDLRNPRKGGIEGGVAPKKFHQCIVRSALWSNVPFILILMWLGGWQAAGVLGVLLFFVVAYSAPYLRFKERPLLDSVSSSIHFVGPLMFALIAAQGTTNAWSYVVAFFLWGMASHAFGAVQDIIPDRKAKIASIATVLGARWTVWMALALYATASCVVAVQSGAMLVVVAGLLYVLNVTPFAKITDATSAQAHVGWRRFLWINMLAGTLISITLLWGYVSQA